MTLQSPNNAPPPPVYGSARIFLQAISPEELYLTYELPGDPHTTLRLAFGARKAARYKLAVRLIDSRDDNVLENRASGWPSGDHNFTDYLNPGQCYRAEVGFLSLEDPFVTLLRSKDVCTPRASVAQPPDETHESAVAAEAVTHLEEAGKIRDALLMRLKRADALTSGEATRTIAERVSGLDLSGTRGAELSVLRELLVDLAHGVTFVVLFERAISEPLKQWLRKMLWDRDFGHGQGAPLSVWQLFIAVHSVVRELTHPAASGVEGDAPTPRLPHLAAGSSDLSPPGPS